MTQRWKWRYTTCTTYAPKSEAALQKCLAPVLDGTVSLTQNDIKWLNASDYVEIYCELVHHGFCDPLCNTSAFSWAVQFFMDGQAYGGWRARWLRKIVRLFQTETRTLEFLFIFMSCICQRQRYNDEHIMPLYYPIRRLLDCDAGRKFAMTSPETTIFLRMITKDNLPEAFTSFLQGEMTEMMKQLRKEGFLAQKSRMNICKEELMAKTWHPDRISKYLEMGYEMDDD